MREKPESCKRYAREEARNVVLDSTDHLLRHVQVPSRERKERDQKDVDDDKVDSTGHFIAGWRVVGESLTKLCQRFRKLVGEGSFDTDGKNTNMA